MRYIFIISSRAGTFRRASMEHLICSRFRGGNNILLLDPPEGLVERICRSEDRRELRLVAVGGDGTVHRVLAAAVRYDIPIGILPCGTANDLAGAIGLKGNLKDCCDVIRADHARAIDLISVNGNLFATCGGLGLPSSAAIRYNSFRKHASRLSAKAFVKSSYLLAALRSLNRGHCPEVRIRNCHPRWSGCVMAVVVSNQARFGAFFSVSPGAVHDDGIFDLCVIPDPASLCRKLGILLQAALRRKMIGPGIIHSRLHRARILTGRAVPFLGDGEILSCGREFRIEVLHRAVRLIVPDKASSEEVQSRSLSLNMFHRGSRQCNPGESGVPVDVRLQDRQGIIEINAARNACPDVSAGTLQL